MNPRVLAAVAVALFVVIAGLSVVGLVGVAGPAATRSDAPPVAPEVATRPRTVLPRPARPVAAAPPAPVAAPEPPPEEAAREVLGELTDRRAEAERAPADVVGAISGQMREVSKDIGACINEWAAVSPDIDGTVNVGFRIDADGLQEAWIVDYEDVPSGPLSCFASAVYDADWEGISPDPIEVTFPFVVTTK